MANTPQAAQVNPPSKPTVTTVSQGSGKGKWLWLLLVIMVAAAAGGTYYYMHQQEQKKTNQVTAQIAGLEAQLTKLQKELKDSSSSSSSTFKVPELGIQFTTTSDLSDLVYQFDNSTDAYKGYALFSTKALIEVGGSVCSPGNNSVPGPLGSITLSTTPPTSTSGTDEGGSLGMYITQIGSKYLYDLTPQSACSPSAPAAPVTSFEAALKTATATQ